MRNQIINSRQSAASSQQSLKMLSVKKANFFLTISLTAMFFSPLFWRGDGGEAAAQFSQLQKIVASDRAATDQFGQSVSISGNYAIVGTQYEDEDASGGNNKKDAGAAYIYERNGSAWTQVQKIAAADRDTGDNFGRSVSISGNYAIVGAWNEGTGGWGYLKNAGAAYIFERNAGTWKQVQKIISSDRGVADNFGSAVSISGNYAIVGAWYAHQPGINGYPLDKPGLAYIFERNTTTGAWTEKKNIRASDQGDIEHFGLSVSISGNYAIVAAIHQDEDATGGNTLTNAGAAYIYERISGTWTQTEVQKIVASDRSAYDEFGTSVGISGNYAIVGAKYESEDAAGGNTIFWSGSAYIFERNAGTGAWAQKQKIVASDRAAWDWFGYSVSISGNYAIVGAYNEEEDVSGGNTMNASGSAYIFERNANTGIWSEKQKIVASDRGAGDQFGNSACISDNYAIVGAWIDDEDAAGGNPKKDAGSAYIFGTAQTPVEQLYANGTFNIIRIYPNPSSAGYIHYTVNSEDKEKITIKVMDVLGREAINQEETIESGITEKKLSTAALSSGSYLLKITNDKQEKTQKQFVVK